MVPWVKLRDLVCLQPNMQVGQRISLGGRKHEVGAGSGLEDLNHTDV